MARGMYDNSYNRNRTRIDTRNQSDPAVQAGMRKIHRGMDGRVNGGQTAEGYGIGTRAGAPASPVAQSGPATAPAVGATPTAPNSLGGGLSRWERLNPNARKAFSAGSPANDKATNRRLAQRMKVKAAPSPAQNFVQAAMPKPAVPSMVPLSTPPAGRTASTAPAAAKPAMTAAVKPATSFAPFTPSSPAQAIGASPAKSPAPRAVAPPKAEPNRWADGSPIVPKAPAPVAAPAPVDTRPVMSKWTPPTAPAKPDARHSNRIASRPKKLNLPNHTMTSPEGRLARLKAEGQANVARKASMTKQARIEREARIAAAQAAVTVPEWQQGTMIGRANAAWKRFSASRKQ